MTDTTPETSSLWLRNPPGREVVRIERLWDMNGEPTVRAHPTHGGRPLVAPVSYLREHYTQIDESRGLAALTEDPS